MDRVALDLGLIQIYWYSIFIFLGILTATIIVCREAKKQKIDEDFLLNLTFNVIVFGILGARIYYVLFNLKYYLANPIEIFQIWNGGLAIHGGILAGLLVTIIYTKKKNINTLKMLDIIVVGLIIAQALGRWGNFFNKEAYGNVISYASLKSLGVPTFIIKGMYIEGAYRQPTFFYESVWCFVGFIAMLMIRKYKYLKVGMLSGFYLIWYGSIRFIIEAMRADSLMLGNLKMAQLMSIVFIIVGLFLFIKSKDNKLYRSD